MLVSKLFMSYNFVSVLQFADDGAVVGAGPLAELAKFVACVPHVLDAVGVIRTIDKAKELGEVASVLILGDVALDHIPAAVPPPPVGAVLVLAGIRPEQLLICFCCVNSAQGKGLSAQRTVNQLSDTSNHSLSGHVLHWQLYKLFTLSKFVCNVLTPLPMRLEALLISS